MENEILVKFKEGVSQKKMQEIAQKNHLQLIKPVSLPDLFLFRVLGGGSVTKVIEILSKEDGVEYAEPNFIGKIQ